MEGGGQRLPPSRDKGEALVVPPAEFTKGEPETRAGTKAVTLTQDSSGV